MKINKLIMTLLTLTALAAAPLVRAADDPMMEPVNSVYTNYTKIQLALVKNSLKDVPETASAIAKAVKGDEMKMLSPDVAQQAEKLAKAKDLVEAREAFGHLSDSLIKYLDEHKVKSGAYKEAYCPMANASWLQTSERIQNPYLGKSMPHCGEIKRTF
jgi:Protein of unknown function (DUF3347)